MRLSLFQRPLFRRTRSQATTASADQQIRDSRANSVQHDDYSIADTPSLSPSPKPTLSSRPRKSSSLARLRERYLAQTPTSDVEVPEAVREQRESLLLPEVEGDERGVAGKRTSLLLTPTSQEEVVRSGASSPPRRSGSETLAGERRSSSANKLPDEAINKQTSVPAIEQLKLEQLEIREQPTLTVEEPTPDVIDAIDGLAADSSSTCINNNKVEGDAGDADQHTDLNNPEASRLNSSRKSSLGNNPKDPQESSTTRTSRVQSSSTGRSLSPFDNSRSSNNKRPTENTVRQQSLVNSANAQLARTLIDAPSRVKPQSIDIPSALPTSDTGIGYFESGFPTNMAHALHRKIWVRRPGASATLVQIREDDLVDDVRDMILRKYANSLGKTFDAPDMTLHVVTKPEHGTQRHERQLGPEEEMCRTIDSYYPGGQTVDDALLINVPSRRTPRPSPRVFQHPAYQAADDYRPLENGTDYFPPMPAIIPTTAPQTSGSHDSRSTHHHTAVNTVPEHARSMSVLNTGQVPPLPSPGGTRRHARDHRPKFNRQHTSSPTIMAHPNAGAVAVQANHLVPQTHLPHRPSGVRNRLDSTASDHHGEIASQQPPPLPTPPAPQAEPTAVPGSQPQTPPVGPVNVPRPAQPRRNRKSNQDDSRSRSRRPNARANDSPLPQPSYAALLDSSVPSINVLIVEDNIINLRILEGLMKRLKVRWTTAMNGQIALDKWRAGGFHLVLMDIQMPIMNGLQATKEIRRLERVNGIGVFSSSAPSSPAEHRSDGSKDPATNGQGEDGEEGKPRNNSKDDKLNTGPDTLFKSPVIIVALTASSLQSDRHEALAAGCNDFLTKPVNFVWLERKVKEWGCMQALIDFDGWRKWKDYADEKDAGKSEEEKRKEAEKEARKKEKMEKFAQHQERMQKKNEEEKREKERVLEANRRKEREEQQQAPPAPAKAKRNSSSGVVTQMNGVKEEDAEEEGEAEDTGGGEAKGQAKAEKKNGDPAE